MNYCTVGKTEHVTKRISNRNEQTLGVVFSVLLCTYDTRVTIETEERDYKKLAALCSQNSGIFGSIVSN